MTGPGRVSSCGALCDERKCAGSCAQPEGHDGEHACAPPGYDVGRGSSCERCGGTDHSAAGHWGDRPGHTASGRTHSCPHRVRYPDPCTCGHPWHRCYHCHDDPPTGHTCPCCGLTAPARTPS